MSPKHWLKRLLFFIPVAAGVAVFVMAVKTKQPPPKAETTERVRTARVVTARTLDVVPVTTVYGTAAPERTWDAVAEVAGQIARVDPRLRDGNLLDKDTALITIDPVTYELRVAEIEAQLAETEVTESNTRALIEIEKRNLALAETSLARKRDLVKRGATPQSAVDQEEQAMLAKQVALRNLQNTLALIPVQRRALATRLAQAKRDLDHTTIRAPFDMRVADVTVEANQYVGVGQTLFKGDAIDRVEVVAQVPLDQMPALMWGGRGAVIRSLKFADAVAFLSRISATVRLPLGEARIDWPATVVRFDDTIDTRTRTVGVVVAVDDPYENVAPGAQPPLVKGMFVQVELKGPPQPATVVVPAQSVRQGTVHLIGEGGTLRSQPVKVRFFQGAAAILSDGLKGGETVIVSDLVPAVDGMRVEGVADHDLAARAEAAARGEDVAR